MFWCEWPRDFVEVTGADARAYLHSQLSQDVQAMGVGEARWSYLLQPNGKVEALVRVTRADEGRFVLDVDKGFGAAVLVRLERFRIRVKVEMEPLAWRCVAVRGDLAERVVVTASGIEGVAVPSWWSVPAAWDLIGPEPRPPEDVPAGDRARLEAARIEAGWPAMGAELTERTIPGEIGPLLDLAVSFTKGCYPGQELLERMDARGAAAPHQLRRLRADRGALEVGEVVLAAGQSVGTVSSAAGPEGLAVLARSVEPGVVGRVDGVTVSILPLR
jgi:folate-binding protein YgfZ